MAKELQIDPNFLRFLSKALEASWDRETAYKSVEERGNRALGQCYPTSHVVRHFFPEAEIVQGAVWTGTKLEVHFWNVVRTDRAIHHVDLTWQQFPKGSVVKSFAELDVEKNPDSETAKIRCALLLGRVREFLSREKAS